MVQREVKPRVPTVSRERYGESRNIPARMPFGMGAPPSEDAAKRCLSCGFGNVPVIEEVIWTINTPLTDAQIKATFGDVVNLFNPSGAVAGVGSIDSTFLVNGILQTDLLCQGIGVHVFHEPVTFEALGNGWTAPAGPGTSQPAASPDVYTAADITNGAVSTGLTPAFLDWGGQTEEAAWNFINAYQLNLKTNQRELMLVEQLADVSYMGAFGDLEGAGSGELNQIQYAALANAQYRLQGSANIYLPANFRRYGSVTVSAANVGLFHPTRDYEIVEATRGGLKLQGSNCKGGMYRLIEKPCFFERGIPIGPQFIVNDPIHQARFQAALSIDDFTGNQNLEVDVFVAGNTLSGSNLMLEQTLDVGGGGPVNVSQAVGSARQVYKGGILKIAVKLKGWEVPGQWKGWCQQNMPATFPNGSGGPQLPPAQSQTST